MKNLLLFIIILMSLSWFDQVQALDRNGYTIERDAVYYSNIVSNVRAELDLSLINLQSDLTKRESQFIQLNLANYWQALEPMAKLRLQDELVDSTDAFGALCQALMASIDLEETAMKLIIMTPPKDTLSKRSIKNYFRVVASGTDLLIEIFQLGFLQVPQSDPTRMSLLDFRAKLQAFTVLRNTLEEQFLK